MEMSGEKKIVGGENEDQQETQELRDSRMERFKS